MAKRRRRPTKKQQALLQPLKERVVILGESMTEACENVGISRTTGNAWREADEAATGKGWDDEARERMGRNPFQAIRLLEDRVEGLIRAQSANLENRYFDQMVGMAMDNLQRLKDRLGDITRTLESLRVVGAWGARRYRDDPEKFDIFCSAIIDCIDDLQSGRFGVEAAG